MRLLHLFANYKWTGPAEPALNLAHALTELGHEVHFAWGRSRDGREDYIAPEAARRKVTPVRGLRLAKHFSPLSLAADVRGLKTIQKNLRPDLIHCHLLGDHMVAALSTSWGSGTPIVRTSYAAEGPTRSVRERMLAARASSALLCVSAGACEAVRKRFGKRRPPLSLVEGAVDTERFDPGRLTAGSLRAREEGSFSVGVVARVQRHREFDLLLRAFQAVSGRHPGLRLTVMGRGTHRQELLEEPIRAMGLSDRVRIQEYLTGDAYVASLAALDCLVYLVPGSDGSARAVREAMAMGVPPIVARRGILPDLVTDAEEGLVIEPGEEPLAAAILALAGAPDRARALGSRARAKAVARWSLPSQARKVEGIYSEVLSGRK